MQIKVIEPEEFEKKIRTPGIYLIEIGIYGLDRKNVSLEVEKVCKNTYGHKIRIPVDTTLFCGHNGEQAFETIFINDRQYYLGNIQQSPLSNELNLTYICFDTVKYIRKEGE